MIEIKMDEAGYEVYYSLDEAVKSFSHNIALENATLDLDIGLLLDSDVDPFSNYGMEAISETVKEMASKAKSNFILYAKKLINFFFGWALKFLSGAVNIKKSMSKNYAKATKYLKALNGYENQARQSSEKTIEITNAGNIIVYGLTMVQLMKWIIVGFTQACEEANDDKELIDLFATTYQIKDITILVQGLPLNDSGALEKMLNRYQYNIESMVKGQVQDSTSKNADRIQKNVDKVSKYKKNASPDDLKNAADKTRDNISSENEGKAAALLNIKKFMSEPERRELKCPDAFDYLRTQLKMFISISKANKWDFESQVKKAENVRRKIYKALDSVDTTKFDEKSLNAALKNVVATGNELSHYQNTVSGTMKVINKCMDMMMTDVTRLGSILTTLGGGPAKDKDAEE